MPPKKNAKKAMSKKGSKKPAGRRRAPYSKTKVPTNRVIADKLAVRLPYTDLTSANGSMADQSIAWKTYNINGLYDPEYGAFNSSALGFSTYSKLYQKYRVYKVDYVITVSNTSSSPSLVAGSINFTNTPGPTSIDPNWLSLPYTRRFDLAPTGSAGSTKVVKGSIYLPRIVGLTSEQYRTNDVYFGTKSTNPVQNIYMVVNLRAVNPNITLTTTMAARFTAHVEWFDFDRTELNSSVPFRQLDGPTGGQWFSQSTDQHIGPTGPTYPSS